MPTPIQPYYQKNEDIGFTPNLPPEEASSLTVTAPKNWDRYTMYPATQNVYFSSVLYQALTDNIGQQPDQSPTAWLAITASATGSVPPTRTVNGHALSANVTVTKGDVGLGNCDNTSDLVKPISTATQTALDAKADKNATALTGIPIYANNAAAVAGGLVVGRLYRSGGDPDVIAIVH